MNSRSILSFIAVAALSGSLTSCFSSSKVDSKNQASVGKQLTDLDAAYKTRHHHREGLPQAEEGHHQRQRLTTDGAAH